MTNTQSIFITWTETQYTCIGRRYIGGGEDTPIMEASAVTKRVRYSSSVNDEMMARAIDYAATMEDKEDVAVKVLND